MYDNKFENFIISFGYTAQIVPILLSLISNPYLLIVWIAGWGWVEYGKMRIKENSELQ